MPTPRQNPCNGAILALHWGYMPSVQIKNVPPEVHHALRQRAATAGQSLQEYLLAQLKRQAQEETLDEVLDRAGGRAGGSLGLAFAAETLRADRKRAA
jgi:antitoxin FitA